jgi:hypothetical protein
LQGAGLGLAKGVGAGAVAAAVTRADAQRVIGYVDQRTAQKVAELLTSNDPRLLAQCSKSRNPGHGLLSRLIPNFCSLWVFLKKLFDHANKRLQAFPGQGYQILTFVKCSNV